MTAPNFFIIGAPKCGTTAWVHYLQSHPAIGFSRQKEPHYFCTDFKAFRWLRQETDYLAQFRHCTGKAAVGEASVQYLYSQEAPGNIARFAPQARLLLFVREPLDFLLSYHNQLLLNLDENIADFATAWAASGRREGAGLPPHCREPRFLDYPAVARFGAHLQRWLQVFPPAQVMVLGFEDWVGAPRASYLRVLAFLGLPDDGRSDFARLHAGRRPRSRMLARLVRRPPPPVLWAARAVRRGLGLERLGLARKLGRLNETPGYQRRPDGLDPGLAAEIRAALAEDQALLRRLREDCAC